MTTAALQSLDRRTLDLASALYSDANEPVGLDIGGDEFPRIRPTATTFGNGFPSPEEWLALHAPSGWLIEPRPTLTQEQAA